MKRKRIWILFYLVTGISITSLIVLKIVYHQFKLNVYDGFEDSTLIAFASSDDTAKWLQAHKSETDKFFEWTKSFEWKTN